MSMTFILFVLLLFAAVFLLFKQVNHSRIEEYRRTQQLVDQAKRLFPSSRVTDSLDQLYEAVYKQLVAAKRQGQESTPYIRDQILIVNERLRIWREEMEQRLDTAERESSFKIIQSKRA